MPPLSFSVSSSAWNVFTPCLSPHQLFTCFFFGAFAALLVHYLFTACLATSGSKAPPPNLSSLGVPLPETSVLVHSPLQELIVLQQAACAPRPTAREVPKCLRCEDRGLWCVALHQVAAGGVHLVHDAVRVLRRVVDVRLVVLHVLRVHRVVEAFTAASLLPPAEDKDADAEEESEDGEDQEDDPPGELCADVEHPRLAA